MAPERNFTSLQLHHAEARHATAYWIGGWLNTLGEHKDLLPAQPIAYQ